MYKELHGDNFSRPRWVPSLRYYGSAILDVKSCKANAKKNDLVVLDVGDANGGQGSVSAVMS